MKINIIKLVNGETLLAEIAHEDDIHLSIIDPIAVNMSMRNNSPVLISTIWMPLTKAVNLFHLKQANIILSSEVDEDMEIYYNKCMDTIREAISSDRTFLIERKQDEMTHNEIEKVLAKIQSQGGFYSNTSIH